MTNKKQKLELTWIGKGEEPKLEPRVLIEDPTKSYGDKNSGNMLIHGDNLLALKALEQDFAGKVKCIYIDPPYNISAATEHYDDNLAHSEWINLMYPRLKVLRTLLRDDGYIFIQIDDEELSILQLVMDEIFGRTNRVNTIVVKMSESSGVKMAHVSKKLPKIKEYLLVYKKSSDASLFPIRISKDLNNDIDKYLKYYGKIISNPESNIEDWEIIPIKKYLESKGLATDEKFITEFKLKNADRMVYRTNNRSFSKLKINKPLAKVISSTGIEYIWWEGKQMLFLSDYTEEYLCDLWMDVSTINLNKEGGVQFPNSKKPEFLIERIIRMCTIEGDLVLDSFLGSGTTVAVAHKMGRPWIGIELGDHANTHCLPRLKSVIDGTDEGGITDTVNWKSGGGFKFYELAPSLITKDKYGKEIINKEYNPNMLASAMCKHMGFKYMPDEAYYWKQGKSTETDYIFTTTQYVTVAMLDSISDDMNPEETLLICTKSYDPECENKYPSINIKKIPQAILGKCEFGQDNYDLNIIEETEESIENNLDLNKDE